MCVFHASTLLLLDLFQEGSRDPGSVLIVALGSRHLVSDPKGLMFQKHKSAGIHMPFNHTPPNHLHPQTQTHPYGVVGVGVGVERGSLLIVNG